MHCVPSGYLWGGVGSCQRGVHRGLRAQCGQVLPPSLILWFAPALPCRDVFPRWQLDGVHALCPRAVERHRGSSVRFVCTWNVQPWRLCCVPSVPLGSFWRLYRPGHCCLHGSSGPCPGLLRRCWLHTGWWRTLPRGQVLKHDAVPGVHPLHRWPVREHSWTGHCRVLWQVCPNTGEVLPSRCHRTFRCRVPRRPVQCNWVQHNCMYTLPLRDLRYHCRGHHLRNGMWGHLHCCSWVLLWRGCH